MPWSFRELFDREFWKLFKEEYTEKILHMGRILLILVIIFQFFSFSIVPSGSMEPTIHVNDYLILERGYLYWHRGDIIVFHYPLDPSELYIKRLIGLPGDTVAVMNGYVYINGKKLIEPYILQKPNYYFATRKVPPHDYFVLGDNRNNSNDSHIWGYVPQRLVVGKVVAIVLPFGRFRWWGW
jgi:signal peptidase I